MRCALTRARRRDGSSRAQTDSSDDRSNARTQYACEQEDIPMTTESPSKRWRPFLVGVTAIAVVAVILSLPAGRGLAGRFFRSLRMQKVQAVNVDLSSFTDPNANPALHEMVAKMISDNVVV